MKRLLAATLAAASLAACTTTSPDVVSRRDAQRMSIVVDGVVLSTRPVVVEGSQSGAGGLAGGVVGGIAGSSAGHSGSRESFAIGVIGALVGAAIGNAVERQGTREPAVEYLIQLRNGERRSVIQASAAEQIIPGDSVIVVTTGSRVRVTRAPVATPATATPPTS